MARRSGRIGGGGLLDHLVIRVDLDISGFLRAKALLIQEIRTMRGAITGTAGGASLGDVMTAAIVAPTIAAVGHLRTMRNEMRLLTSEMRNVAAIGFSGGGGGRGGALVVPMPGGGPIIDASRRQGRRADGTLGPHRYQMEGDDLTQAARGGGFASAAAAGAGAAGGSARRRGFGGWFGRMFSPGRTASAFEEGRAGFPGYSDAVENLGGGAHAVGAAGRRAAGSRIAQALGLVGLGGLMSDLVRLAASLATVIGGSLTGAFAALLTPLGAVVALVTALVGLFVAANWDQFKEFGNWFADRWRDIIGGEGMGDIISGWNALKDAFSELWDTIKTAFHDESNSIGAVLRFFGEAAIRICNAVMEVLGALMRTIAELVRTVAALIRGDWQEAWNHLGEAVRQVFRGVLDTITSIIPEWQGALDSFADGVENTFRRVGAAIANAFGGNRGNVPNARTGGAGGNGRGRMYKSAANDNGKGSFGKALGGGLGDMAGFAGIENAMPGDLSPSMERMVRLADQFGSSITNALDALVLGGAKAKDVLRSLVVELGAMIIRSTLIEPLGNAISSTISGTMGGGGGKKNGGGGGFWSTLMSSFAGFFADGGFIPPGMFGVTGERGPEIVSGGRSGKTITPMGGGGFNYVDQRRFDMRGASVDAVMRLEQALANDRAELPSRIAATVGNMKQRGRL